MNTSTPISIQDFRFFPQEYARFRGDILEYFVSSVLPGQRSIVDPMCGTASLLPYCQILGVESFFSDLLPVHFYINKAKTINVWRAVLNHENEFGQSIEQFIIDYFDQYSDTSLLISDSWFHEKALFSLLSAWKKADTLNEQVSTFIKATILLSARSFSSTWNSSANTYWHRPGGISLHKPLPEVITEVVTRFRNLWQFYEKYVDPSYSPPLAHFIVSDAKNHSYDTPINTIITSPPYPNRFDYARMFSPELSFLSELSHDKFTELSLNQIATNSVRGFIPSDEDICYLQKRSNDLKDFLDLTYKLGKKGENNYYFRYFTLFYLHLFKLLDKFCNILSRNGTIYFVVQNNIHRGELNALSDYCADCLTFNGLIVDNSFRKLRTHQGIRNISKEHSVYVKRHHELVIRAQKR